ncbi:hypothetical protein C8A03DRAFT_13157 [Achaetomium macrosporum]|uniref:Uncharacterized protein n=1 Tax=Achaetomium macrosporum TaxID=79813 RepID=A0AAN7CFT6_9PEZI|nr:hypothetical protein C8A03DRAFT_13157 [Achaetomium macrosporum]
MAAQLHRAACPCPARARCGAPRGARSSAEPQKCPESLALGSKFSLSRNEDILVLRTVIEPESPKLVTFFYISTLDSISPVTLLTLFFSISSQHACRKRDHRRDRQDGRSRSSNATGQSGKKSKNKKKEKSAEESAPPTLPAGDGPLTSAQKWAFIWKLLENNPEMGDDPAFGHLQSLFDEDMAVLGAAPICANPTCGQVGHTLAVCPVPTDMVEGVVCGCFFCNVLTHDADDCPMMEWVTPITLVTHLITNRAGMPPWNTRIDWVKLAINNWDMVCFVLLPLTRAYVKREYIRLKRWEEVKGLLPITDPLFQNADRKLLQRLAQPTAEHPLKEDSTTMCCCQDACNEHAVYRNEQLKKYLRDPAEVQEEACRFMEARAREVAAAAAELEVPKKVPKKANKDRKKGRRVLKKEALAAAAATGEAENTKGEAVSIAGPCTEKPKEENKHNDSPSDEDKEDMPVSDRLLALADKIDQVYQNLRGIVET